MGSRRPGVAVAAPAKINLALRVGPPRGDGYHPVATLMAAVAGLEDEVEVRRAPSRRVVCPGVAERANLAWRALDALEGRTGRAMDLEVRITKRIPAQAGLGGGSSDAAATLRAARALLDLPLTDDDLEDVAATVGSDVPFFVRGGAQWATGRGEVLRPVHLDPLAAVVTPPGRPLATAAVYAAFDRIARAPADPEPSPLTDPLRDPHARNDLWPAALALAPALGAVARRLHAAGAARVLLCGSGGAMAGLWGTAAEATEAARRMGDGALAAVTLPGAAAPIREM